MISFETWAEAVVSFMDRHGVSSATWVGHSLSGRVLCAAAAKFPDRVHRLVFVAAPIPPTGQPQVALFPEPLRNLFHAIQESGATSIPRLPPDLLGLMCNDLDPDACERADSICVPEALNPFLQAVQPWAPPVRPSIYVRLTRDEMVSPALQTASAERLQVSDIVDFPTGHMAMLSRPEALARLLETVD